MADIIIDTSSHYITDSDMASVSTTTSSKARWTDFESFGRSIGHTNIPAHVVDQLLGRDLVAAAPPAHFSRVLFIPRHDRHIAHLPLYDVSTAYARAVGDAPMGSSKYRVELALMRRPTGDGHGDIVSHLLTVHGGVRGVLERRGGDAPAETTIALPGSGSGTFAIDSGRNRRTNVSASFPLADQRTPGGIIRFPYFDVDIGGREQWQWQIHPCEHGALRYTLVRSSDDLQPKVVAVYHHVGVSLNLPADYSEGVLLLPEGGSEVEAELAVASLLGFLWQLRDMHPKKRSLTTKLFRGRRA
ncbi:hypothetical protein F5X68DRAFT_216101 [Plectosphaerella plurivora]|uniref:Uncharacterized protein n=1 Tax=Plectosphaerella plurivora TaxID=936078 RepID=A0A9P8V3P4_9PEZI|nr:hypothetical protein F5X68DRAFT_216101 [Plectosphaerella plurivora]